MDETTTETNGRKVEYHAEALDDRGRTLPDRVWGWEMPVLADVKTVEAAREWARELFERDDRAARVTVRETYQEWYGGVWKSGRHVETVVREGAAPAVNVEHELNRVYGT